MYIIQKVAVDLNVHACRLADTERHTQKGIRTHTCAAHPHLLIQQHIYIYSCTSLFSMLYSTDRNSSSFSNATLVFGAAFA